MKYETRGGTPRLPHRVILKTIFSFEFYFNPRQITMSPSDDDDVLRTMEQFQPLHP